MATNRQNSALGFILWAILFHCITYFVAGFVFSGYLDYRELFKLPVIGDYYRSFDSVHVAVGPLVQVLRGAIFGVVLLPVRDSLLGKPLGWLWLWLILVGIGIVSTPAAAPSSIEGLVYSRLPLWFHFWGLQEILAQTLVFSILLHQRFSEHRIIRPGTPFAAVCGAIFRALSAACLAFAGYALVSVLFALAVGGSLGGGANPLVLGQFVAPLVLIFLVQLIRGGWPLVTHGLLYMVSVLSFYLYQYLVLDEANVVYASLAPLLPTYISYVIATRAQGRKTPQQS